MPVDWFPLWLSVRVATIATILSLALGLWLAHILANRSFFGKELLDAVVTLPLVLPPTVLGYYLLVAIGRSGVRSGRRISGCSARRWCSHGRRRCWHRRSMPCRCW